MKREIIRFAGRNQKDDRNEIDWQNVDQVVPNASAKWAFKLHSRLKCGGQLERFPEIATSSDSNQQFEKIIEPIVRRTDDRTRNEILRLVNEQNMYHTEAAEQLRMDVEHFVKVYNALMVNCKEKIFSKIDLAQAYHKIPMEESSIPKTAVLTPKALYEYVYDLKTSSQTFARFMQHVLGDFKFVFVYIIYTIYR